MGFLLFPIYGMLMGLHLAALGAAGAPLKTGFLRLKRVYLGIRTCELFLCFVAIVRVRVYLADFFCFACFTSLVSFIGSYTEVEPLKMGKNRPFLV